MVFSMPVHGCVFLKQQIRSVGMQVKHINNVYIKNKLDHIHGLDFGCIKITSTIKYMRLL